MMSDCGIDADEFRMWRAVFAFALVDGVLSLEEQKILSHYADKVAFNDVQLDSLRGDLETPQNVETLYNTIETSEHQQRFCELARALVWCDGDIDRQEKEILKRVSCFEDRSHAAHFKNSAKSLWMKFHIEKYEDIAFMKVQNFAPMFQTAV